VVAAGDSWLAARERDAGMRKVSRLTWRAGVAGVACSALIAVALGHHAGTAAGSHPRQQPGTILIPGQPPAPVNGPGQVTSGAS
jgi:hypothetical protein